ncbi:MAG: preprotein translocase subunit SecG [Chromatiales bacterium]|nr:preprotein translocase subunit SecG [Chromatiales bacterium]
MLALLIAFHMIIAVALVTLVLVQRGRGAEAGAAFGSGASQTVFGSRGSASFLTRSTAVLAALFFISSLALAYVYSQRVERASVTKLPTSSVPAPDRVPGQADVPAMPSTELDQQAPVTPDEYAEPEASPSP